MLSWLGRSGEYSDQVIVYWNKQQMLWDNIEREKWSKIWQSVSVWLKGLKYVFNAKRWKASHNNKRAIFYIIASCTKTSLSETGGLWSRSFQTVASSCSKILSFITPAKGEGASARLRGREAPRVRKKKLFFFLPPPLSLSLSLSVARSVSTIKVYISAQGPAIHLPDISRRDARLRAAEHSEEKEYCRSSFAVLQVPVVVGRVDLRRRFCGRAAAPALWWYVRTRRRETICCVRSANLLPRHSG